MKTRYYIVALVCFSLVLAVFAICMRTSFYTLSWEEFEDSVTVAYLTDELGEQTLDLMEESLEEEPYILSVECIGEPELYYSNVVQKVRVIHSYAGDCDVEEELYILQVNAIYEHNDDMVLKKGMLSSANMSFTNVFEVGENYLVFLNHREDHYYRDMVVLEKSDEYLVKPFFSYGEVSSQAVDPSRGTGSMSIRYTKVYENEYFMSEKSLNHMLAIKEAMLAKYPL